MFFTNRIFYIVFKRRHRLGEVGNINLSDFDIVRLPTIKQKKLHSMY